MKTKVVVRKKSLIRLMVSFPGSMFHILIALNCSTRVVPEAVERLTRVEGPIAQSVELGMNKPVFCRQAMPQARISLSPFLYPAPQPDAPVNTKHLIEPSAGRLRRRG